MAMKSVHEENNEIIVAKSKRENVILGKEASLAILSKLNDTLNNLYVLLKSLEDNGY